MNRMFIDLETRSDADITKTGVYRYADSPCFDILLFAVSIDDALTVSTLLLSVRKTTESVL